MNRLKRIIKKIPYSKKIYSLFRATKKDSSFFFNVELPIIARKALNKKTVFIILTPEHGNLGDHAIAEGERRIMTKLGLSYYEVSQSTLFEFENKEKLGLFNGSPITINGGGYLGTLWFNDERLVRKIVLSNPDSRILLFPNTVYYENDENGRREYQTSRSIYHSHKALKIYAREKKSLDTLKDLSPCCAIAPDMAMLLHADTPKASRAGCSLFLRQDKEKTRTEEDTKAIVDSAIELFNGNVHGYDTVLPYHIPLNRRQAELEKIFSVYRSSELVITDRLHGMIFGAITGTPCIVVNSKSHKVRGCYEWLKHLDYIRMCDDVSNIKSIYKDMPHGGQVYKNEALIPYYSELINDLKAIGEKK